MKKPRLPIGVVEDKKGRWSLSGKQLRKQSANKQQRKPELFSQLELIIKILYGILAHT